jgi:excisionase family DNA binding protein
MTATNAGLVDIAAAAERLGVTVRYVRRLVEERRIPYVKFGHFLRFDPPELDDWIDRARVTEIADSSSSRRARSRRF